jgi:hypothetical protein
MIIANFKYYLDVTIQIVLLGFFLLFAFVFARDIIGLFKKSEPNKAELPTRPGDPRG